MSEEKLKIFFNKYAQKFESIYKKDKNVIRYFVDKIFRRSIYKRFEKTLKECYPLKNKTVVDIGCGPGQYSIAFAKMGARYVLGLDISEKMIELARNNAQKYGVEKICEFKKIDFMDFSIDKKFDYAVVMGVMDYVKDSEGFVKKVMKIIRKKAVFSFPKKGGFLAWQREKRYRLKGTLIFFYTFQSIKNLLKRVKAKNYKIEKIHRDYFVTIYKE